MQTVVFPQYPGFVGKYGDQLRLKRYSWWPWHLSWQRQTPGWQNLTQTWVRAQTAANRHGILLSSEGLSQWPIRGAPTNTHSMPVDDDYMLFSRKRPHPVSEMLTHLHLGLSNDWEINVILTLRRQFDFLASLYAENARYMVQPSQSDFDAKLRTLCRTTDSYCDYATLVEEIDDVVQPKNMHVLLFEDGISHNVRRLSRILEFPLHPVEGVRHNHRQAVPGTWLLERRRDKTLHGRLRLPLGRQSTDSIGITACGDLPSLVNSTYRKTNIRLGERLGRDIAALGY